MGDLPVVARKTQRGPAGRVWCRRPSRPWFSDPVVRQTASGIPLSRGAAPTLSQTQPIIEVELSGTPSPSCGAVGEPPYPWGGRDLGDGALNLLATLGIPPEDALPFHWADSTPNGADRRPDPPDSLRPRRSVPSKRRGLVQGRGGGRTGHRRGPSDGRRARTHSLTDPWPSPGHP